MVSKFSQFVPREPKLTRVIGSFEKSGVKLQGLSEANPRETRFGSRYREVRETEGSRNRDSTVIIIQTYLYRIAASVLRRKLLSMQVLLKK